MRSKSTPITLKIPTKWLRYSQSLAYLLASSFSLSRRTVHRLVEEFAFCNDEEKFAKTLLQRKKNLWVFRTSQKNFCGDFVIVDMSSPDPSYRQVFILDLKFGARLKIGGGGAGIQFSRSPLAIEDIAKHTGIIPTNAKYELLSGDRREILTYLGIKGYF